MFSGTSSSVNTYSLPAMVDLSVWPAAVAGGRWPVAGGRWSVVWPAASGRWPVAGGRWSVAGGCGPVVVGPVAGGRWSVAGGCGPVVVGPVAGGRGRWSWSGVCGRWPVVRSSPAASEGSKASAMPKGPHVQHTLGITVSCSDITSMR